MPRRPQQGSHPGMPSPEGRPSPEQVSGELPWTPAEREMLEGLVAIIAPLRDRARAGTLSEEEAARFTTASFALVKAKADKEQSMKHSPEVGEFTLFAYDTAKARERASRR